MILPMASTLVRPATALARFHALSDPTRLEIVRRLRHGERCVCELQDLLDAAQSRLSFHLKVLRESGLITDRKDGRWVYYTLSHDALDEVGRVVDDLRSTLPGREPAACC